MIGDDHQIANIKIGRYATSSVRHQKSVDAQQFHYPYWKNDLFSCIPFVKMKSSTHRYHLFAAKLAKDQFALVTFHGGNRKIGDILVGQFFLDLHFSRKVPQPAAQHDPDLGGY